MIKRAAATTLILILVIAPLCSADPILKPKKYHGPIPQSSISLRVGFMGGANNTSMISFLDRDRLNFVSDDFATSFSVDAAYMYKPHPQVAIRIGASASFLRSTGDGSFVKNVSGLPDSIPLPLIDYDRKFDVDLFVVELSGVYFFNDASVNEFQSYIGGGFGVGIPHAKLSETRVDTDTRLPEPSRQRERWSAEAAVHGLLGMFYYFTNKMAMNAEGRVQIMQTKFPLAILNELGEPEDVKFDINLNTFYLSIGVTRAF